MRVLCLKFGTKYGADYVLKLRNACKRRLPPHQFVCLTDDPVEGVTCDSLPEMAIDPRFEGWWYKVGLFEPGRFPGNNLYLDLDVVLTGGLDPFIDAFHKDPSRLWALDDFSYSVRNPNINAPAIVGRNGQGTINSSVMLWRNGVARQVWDDFTPEVMDELHGDQNWITTVLWPHGIHLLPDGVAKSYKYHIRRGEAVSPLVIFHGEPKPANLDEEWIVSNWK